MKRLLWRAIGVWAGVVVLGCEGEPRFEGRPLSFWHKELREGSDMARSRAAHALGQMAPAGRHVIPDLIARLQDDPPYVRVEAAAALGKFGAQAKAAVPALSELYQKERIKPVRDAVGDALLRIDPEAAARLGIP